MRSRLKIIVIVLTTLILFDYSYGQDSRNPFKSGAGGFQINLPRDFTTTKDLAFDDGNITGSGKFYTWEKPQSYFYQIFYYKLDTDKKSLSPKEKSLISEPFREALLKEPKEKGVPVMEKDYFFNGNKGTEIQIIFTEGKSITRYFFVNKRLYYLNAMFNHSLGIAQVTKLMDSFSLLDFKTIVELKIEESTPKPLPQEPVAAKIKTDAQDSNLKGKIETVIEEIQESPNTKREQYSEKYYNEAGNLVKEISFDEGYPSDVTVWGYIDGSRVNDVGFIYFDEDQRPPPKRLTVQGTVVGEENLPKDERYHTKYKYRYDEQGRLVEKWNYSNDGTLQSRNVYNYTENKREELNFGSDGSQWSQTIEFLDNNGNVIEEHSIYDGKVGMKLIYNYEFDSQRNWIVEKISKKVKVKGKTILKHLSASYRTITYYP